MNSSTGEWDPTPMDFCLSSNHIDVFQSPTLIPPETLASFREVLSEDEHRKADRLRDPAKRMESQVSRGMLRCLLGHALRTDPKIFMYNAKTKIQ